MVRRVRRPLVVGTGVKGSPPPAATAPKGEVSMPNAEVQAAGEACEGKECVEIPKGVEPVPKAIAEGAVIAAPGAPPQRGRNKKAGA